MYRGYRATFVGVVAAVALAALVPRASAAAPGISVVFKGTGTYSVHQAVNGTNNGGCTLTTNDTFTLNWETDYTVSEPNPPDTRVAGMVPGKVKVGPGTFALTGDATGGSIARPRSRPTVTARCRWRPAPQR